LINKETLVEKESPPSASLNAPNLNLDGIKAITNDEVLQKRLSKMQIIEGLNLERSLSSLAEVLVTCDFNSIFFTTAREG